MREMIEEWYQNLPILPYGEITDKNIQDAFKQILTWKKERVFISTSIPDNKFTVVEYWLYLGLLQDCIEYGSSPRMGWLTEFGEEVLRTLTKGYVE